MANILIIDDDTELTDLLTDILELEGFTVDCANNGLQGLEKVSESTDLVLLDVMMPVLNGMETLRRLRENSETPVLMLTAKGEEIDRVMGLELGADDYLPKPFSDRELLARMRAILRRTNGRKASEEAENAGQHDEIRYHDLVIYPGKVEVLCGNLPVELTAMETAMLTYLLQRPGEVVAKAELSENVLGKRLAPFDRAVDVHVSNLRKKLPEREDGKPRIKTLRGRGYLLVEV